MKKTVAALVVARDIGVAGRKASEAGLWRGKVSSVEVVILAKLIFQFRGSILGLGVCNGCIIAQAPSWVTGGACAK